MSYTKTISGEDIGKRLDVFLTETIENSSRSHIQKRIKAGDVMVNGKDTTPHYALREDDVIVHPDLTKKEELMKLQPRDDINLSIMFEDDDVIVVDKRSGLLVHPNVPDETKTLANGLLANYPELEGVGDGVDRPGIVHRLDKEASGLLVVARNQSAYDNLKTQFHEHTILKEYKTLVHDGPVDDTGTITFAIARLKGSGRMAAKPEGTADARPAVTHFTVDERFTNATLLTVRTETGRTHQIRVHLKALDMPIAGDKLYMKKTVKTLPTTRLFLHAKTLEFNHPTSGERMRFTSALPKGLEDTLTKLR